MLSQEHVVLGKIRFCIMHYIVQCCVIKFYSNELAAASPIKYCIFVSFTVYRITV